MYEWRKKDNMELIDIENKCKEQFNIHAAEGLFEGTASGHMFKPVIIGKARRARAFAHLDKELTGLPVHYDFNNTAWMATFCEKTEEFLMPPMYLKGHMLSIYDIETTLLKRYLDLQHNILSEHQKDEHLKLLKDLENMTIKCFEMCSDTIILPTPPVHDDEPIPSTSALDTIVNSTTSFDEQEHFGTQNKDYLDSELHVEVIESMSSDNLANLEVTYKDESSDTDPGNSLQFSGH